MNEIKKCSISGVAFTFEKVAYNRLSEYIDSLKRAYKNSTECDEIIADIEARIAELILSAQSDQSQVVCLPLIENINSEQRRIFRAMMSPQLQQQIPALHVASTVIWIIANSVAYVRALASTSISIRYGYALRYLHRLFLYLLAAFRTV